MKGSYPRVRYLPFIYYFIYSFIFSFTISTLAHNCITNDLLLLPLFFYFFLPALIQNPAPMPCLIHSLHRLELLPA